MTFIALSPTEKTISPQVYVYGGFSDPEGEGAKKQITYTTLYGNLSRYKRNRNTNLWTWVVIIYDKNNRYQ
jgi:hypothetical protein